ncbi:MAG: CocE/NonD family hydrolase, partial [Myxococcota bacterium]
GRYRSSGDFLPLTHDGDDGRAVIRWLAAYERCNGRVGTRGHSYSGYNQLLAAIDAPEALQAMVVGVAPGDCFENVPFHGGAYDLNDLFWLLDMTGRVAVDDAKDADDEEDPVSQESCPEDETIADKDRDQLLDQALSNRPFCDVDIRLGLHHPIFREWISHWKLDDYWKERAISPNLHRTNVATLFISGWWDGNGRGAPVFHSGMRARAASPDVRKKQRLLIGPWNHDLEAPDCSDVPEQEQISIERGARRDSLVDELAWFDEHLMDIAAGPSTCAPTSLYVTGLHRWMDFEQWPPPETTANEAFLGPGSDQKSGRLLDQPNDANEKPTVYVFDPEDPTPFAHEDVDAEKIPFDNSELARDRDDIILFETSPYSKPVTLIGEVDAVLYASADTADFDLCAKLLDVYPDGRAIYLTDGIIRARFGNGFANPEPVPAGEIREYRLDLWHIGHTMRPGHTLRLEVSSGAHLRFDVNPCTGGDLANETECTRAKISIYHNEAHPSRLILPVCNDPRLK